MERVSMLGKLFQTAASSLTPRSTTPIVTSRPATTLESVQEDIHTRNLLFPDAEALYQHRHDQLFPLSSSAPLLTSSTNAFDVHPDIELDFRDVRVVVMQEAAGAQTSATLLYDSHPPPPSPNTEGQSYGANGSGIAQRSGGGRTIVSPRRTSLGQASKPVAITPEGSVPRSFGAFDRRPSNHNRVTSHAETEIQRSAREHKEETTVFANCMFGASDIMAYKVTGTKVHIIPTESKLSFAYDGQGSLGRSSVRSSRLAQSYTSESVIAESTLTGHSVPVSGPRVLEKKKFLVTRIFPVPLPNAEPEEEQLVPASLQDRSNANGTVPSSTVSGDPKPPGKKPRQKKTPMYAIGLIVTLPAGTHLPSTSTPRSAFRGPSSYTDQESFPSSYNSTKPSGWTVLGNVFGVESLDSSSFSDYDDRIDIITQNWDIITRTLSHLQLVVSATVLSMLKQIDLATPDPAHLRAMSSHLRTSVASVSVSGKRVEEAIKPFKLPSTKDKLVQLPAHALAAQQKIKNEVDGARQRIVTGVKTLQVVTRQGRWGVWREEARWVSKWAGGKEEGFFFYNLLTGFLGTHTEWLKDLAPEAYRKLHYQQQRAGKGEGDTISARTIIVAHDKMAARRLVFLLSAFLPPNQQLFPSAGHRPRTAVSFDGYSRSPPSNMPFVVREESLRRKVKRRNGPPRVTRSRAMSSQTQVSNSSSTAGAGQISEEDQDRRDLISLRTANLPIPGSDGNRKGSTATTTTVTPITANHFSARRPTRGTGPIPRPGSSGSLVTDDLIRTLKRGDSTGQFSTASPDLQGSSRWGSMFSIWSPKRRESTSTTELSPSVQSGESGDSRSEKANKLAEMVKEVSKNPTADVKEMQVGSMKTPGTSISFTTPVLPDKGHSVEQEPRPIHPNGAYESPVKTSINHVDGVIDIDVPLPDFITSSFGSTISSPSSSGYLSTHGFGPGLEGFEHYSRNGNEDMPLNVGGWLPGYHPDFALQAIPPQDRLLEEIKASMSAEPTPSMAQDDSTRWVEVSTALIADAISFKIKRVCYSRHIMWEESNECQNQDSAFKSRYGNPYGTASQPDRAYTVIDERFTEDEVMSMDEILVDAIERMISQSGSNSNSKPGSGSSSRSGSTSRVRTREGSNLTTKGIPHSGATEIEPPKVPEAHLSVPRHECKKTILGTLEEIARQVADGGEEDGATSTDERVFRMQRDGILREGIRCWMTTVEDYWA